VTRLNGIVDDIARAISQKNVGAALRLIFEGSPPRPRLGRNKETDLWDYKRDCPGTNHDELTENGWAHIAADVLAFHNNQGGLLLFGVEDHSYRFCGATRTIDSKKFNDRLRRYVGDLIWVDFHREYIQPDQRYLGVALIPPGDPRLLGSKATLLRSQANVSLSEAQVLCVSTTARAYLIPRRPTVFRVTKMAPFSGTNMRWTSRSSASFRRIILNFWREVPPVLSLRKAYATTEWRSQAS
jgi:hypothetical protein